MARQAGPVAQRVAHCQVLGHVAVIHFKVGQIGLDWLVKVTLALVTQNAHRRGDKSLGCRRDGVNGVLVSRDIFFNIGESAAAEKALSVFVDADDNRRDMVFFADALNNAVEALFHFLIGHN